MLETWKALIPPDVYKTLERYGSGAYIPWLVHEAGRLGKIPFCVDVTASYWAQMILGPTYAIETVDEYGQRHLASCQDEDCRWCEEERAFVMSTEGGTPCP